MKRIASLSLLLALFAASGARGGTVLESAESFLDLRESPRVSAGTETLTYSTRWAGADALAVNVTNADFDLLKQQADVFSLEQIMRCISILSDTFSYMGKVPPSIGLKQE